MTETARSVIIDAMEDIVVQTEEASLEASEERAAIRALNRLMNSLAAKGINLGYSTVSKLSDEVTVPDGALDGIVASLALRLWPKYRTGDPGFQLRLNAKEGMESLFSIAVTVGSSEFPSTLPTGSGNDYPDYTDQAFYPDLQDTILAETNGSISLEDDTESA